VVSSFATTNSSVALWKAHDSNDRPDVARGRQVLPAPHFYALRDCRVLRSSPLGAQLFAERCTRCTSPSLLLKAARSLTKSRAALSPMTLASVGTRAHS